jgi:hypothetical protein
MIALTCQDKGKIFGLHNPSTSHWKNSLSTQEWVAILVNCLILPLWAHVFHLESVVLAGDVGLDQLIWPQRVFVERKDDAGYCSAMSMRAKIATRNGFGTRFFASGNSQFHILVDGLHFKFTFLDLQDCWHWSASSCSITNANNHGSNTQER